MMDIFRVWDVQRKVLANVTSILWLSEDEVEIDHDKNGFREPFQIHPDTAVLERFIRVSDKHKKQIFEGDIIKHNETLFVVEFSETQLGFICIDRKHRTRGRFPNWRDGQWIRNVSNHIEVVGNIHELPDGWEEA